MKRVLLVALVLMLALPAFADVDLSGLTFEELVTLRAKVQSEMMTHDEWQEVTVPAGVYKIGVDIPAGHWHITPVPSPRVNYVHITYCDQLDAAGKEAVRKGSKVYFYVSLQAHSESPSDVVETDIDMAEGVYLIIEKGSVVFTPYTGKNLGFK